MEAQLRQRTQPALPPATLQSATIPGPDLAAGMVSPPKDEVSSNFHPGGEVANGRPMQILRGVSFVLCFVVVCLTVQLTQWIGSPLYYINRDLFYDYMAVTKEYFGLADAFITYWWGRTTVRISGDESVKGQIRRTADGRAEFAFPERMILVANHQIYTDWLYLWWVGYANNPRMHGHIYIILKESLKYLPVIGPGMMFYGFIFMSRKMAVDQPRMAHRLQKLKETRIDAAGKSHRRPMWLLLFPEGTTASANGRAKSAKWAAKTGYRDPQHMLLPRSTGMYFCLQELKDTLDYVYDCTVAYEGLPRGKYGEDYFTIASTYFRGQPPKSVNFHWRRFRVADIPLETTEAFDQWLRDRWDEKDAMMETFHTTGRMPASPEATAVGEDAYIETEVRTRYPFEILQMFSVVSTVWMVYRIIAMYWR